MLAMTPLITIQLLGVAYQLKLKQVPRTEQPVPEVDDEIIDLL